MTGTSTSQQNSKVQGGGGAPSEGAQKTQAQGAMQDIPPQWMMPVGSLPVQIPSMALQQQWFARMHQAGGEGSSQSSMPQTNMGMGLIPILYLTLEEELGCLLG